MSSLIQLIILIALIVIFFLNTKGRFKREDGKVPFLGKKILLTTLELLILSPLVLIIFGLIATLVDVSFGSGVFCKGDSTCEEAAILMFPGIMIGALLALIYLPIKLFTPGRNYFSWLILGVGLFIVVLQLGYIAYYVSN